MLFSVLREAGYEWQPQTPDRLLSQRRDPSPFRPLVQLFGLGLPVPSDDLLLDGLTPALVDLLETNELIRSWRPDSSATASPSPFYKAAMSISRSGDVFVVHDHWPPDLAREGGYAHYGAESEWLARALSRDLEGFIGKKVLDLGCGSGALSFEVAAVADTVAGLDISERAIAWARLTAEALGYRNVRFEVAAVGESSGDHAARGGPWDCVVMNPPMVVPAKDASYSHRDGGRLGIELPLKFLDYAWSHLCPGGEVQTLSTNPIVGGRPAFFERLPMDHWEVLEKRCLHSHFNQAVARKQGYAEQGIEHIELWFLHLKRLK